MKIEKYVDVDDICKIMCEKTNLPFDFVKSNVNYIIKRTGEMAMDEDSLLIVLSDNLGALYLDRLKLNFNRKNIAKTIKNLKKPPQKTLERRDYLDKRLKLMQNYPKILEKDRSYAGDRAYVTNLKKSKDKIKARGIENFQNNIYNEYKARIKSPL